MKGLLKTGVLAAALALPGIAGAGGSELTIKFDKGLKLESADQSFKLKFGGRIQADTAYFDADNELEALVGEFANGSEFRRARLEVEGQIYDVVVFKIQLDFAGDNTAFKDVYVGIKGLPGVGTVIVGHFKEKFSLEELTSSKYTTFMERSLANVFSPSRNTGIGFSNATENQRITYALGLFQDADDRGNSVCDNHNVTGRITGLPWVGEDGDLIHLGASASRRNPCDNEVRFRQRPEAHLGERIVDTGSGTITDADSVDVYGIELAGIFGPLSFQAEAVQAAVDSASANDPDFNGHYAQVSYFLTGEKRNYKRSAGAFDKVSPNENFGTGGKGGKGAFEVALRYSGIDLNDGAISGGEADSITAGLNWYLNPNARVMLNVGQADVDGLDNGKVTTVQSRFQVFW